ncbi:MAG: hypothetical protein R3335_11200 [Anaerolineales bacterium]|nr:hypothetical protein [Anaerolineales bacterium]
MDDSEIVLSEDFDGPDSCLINGPSSEGGEIYQEGGELHIIAPPAPREFELAPPLTWSVCEDETLSDFIVEVDATTLDGTVNNGYGILFRANEDRFYAYFISADGFDCLAFMDIGAGEEYPAVGCWSQIDEINQGMETNRIRVEAVDDELRIFVNGVLVGLARENFAYRGQVGLFAASYANQETHVSFDNLLVVEK